MPLLDFKKQFADAVESGEKRCTIRAYRKDGRDPKPGDTLYLYTGLRTKSCRKLKVCKCKSVTKLRIGDDFVQKEILRGLFFMNSTKIAHLDGFDNKKDFFDFFKKTHGLPFRGLLIEW